MAFHETFPRGMKAAVALGNFDGVHLGHRKIISVLKEKALEHGVQSCAVTFRPHPQKILKNRSVRLLMPFAERVRLLEKSGVDMVVKLEFSRELSLLPPERFIREVMVERAGMKAMVVGPRFGFGNKRLGDVKMLRALGEKFGFETVVLEPVVLEPVALEPAALETVASGTAEYETAGRETDGSKTADSETVAYKTDGSKTADSETVAYKTDGSKTVDGETVASPAAGGERVSSTAVREFVLGGRVEEASRMLGYRYYIRGVVAEGEKRGREIGFPTVNLKTDWEILPKPGVYATLTGINGEESRPSITNVGSRPTFGGGATVIESHLLDTGGDFYGKRSVVEFVRRIRDEKKFNSAGELSRQIAKDIGQVRAILKNCGGGGL